MESPDAQLCCAVWRVACCVVQTLAAGMPERDQALLSAGSPDLDAVRLGVRAILQRFKDLGGWVPGSGPLLGGVVG